MSEGAPSRGCLTTKTAIEARVKRLIEDFTVLVRDALSTPLARRKFSRDPDIAADLAVTFTRGLTVMEPAYRNPQHLEKVSQQFVRSCCREPGAAAAANREFTLSISRRGAARRVMAAAGRGPPRAAAAATS